MRRDFEQIEHLIRLIKKMEILFKEEPSNLTLRESIYEAVCAVNREEFGAEEIPLLPVEIMAENVEKINRQLAAWIHYQEEEIRIRRSISVKIDYDFHVFMEHVKYSTRESLQKESRACLEDLRNYSNNIYQKLIESYNAFSDFWGSIDLDHGELELIENRVNQLKEHTEDFLWLYQELADYRSKKVLYGILRCWITFEFEEKNQIKENNFADYYDFDLISCSEDEVFVDLGAYNGDSACSYIDNFGNYKRIYCYEITPASMEEMKEKLKEHQDIIYRNVGVGKKKGEMYLDDHQKADSANRLKQTGKQKVEVVTLDEDITEKITFIKMDIEGCELDAIEGARRHIREERPKLAVCTYHNNHHIWEIPRKLKEYRPDYKLYMRYNGELYAFQISEFVTFAL